MIKKCKKILAHNMITQCRSSLPTLMRMNHNCKKKSQRKYWHSTLWRHIEIPAHPYPPSPVPVSAVLPGRPAAQPNERNAPYRPRGRVYERNPSRIRILKFEFQIWISVLVQWRFEIGFWFGDRWVRFCFVLIGFVFKD